MTNDFDSDKFLASQEQERQSRKKPQTKFKNAGDEVTVTVPLNTGKKNSSAGVSARGYVGVITTYRPPAPDRSVRPTLNEKLGLKDTTQ